MQSDGWMRDGGIEKTDGGIVRGDGMSNTWQTRAMKSGGKMQKANNRNVHLLGEKKVVVEG